MTLASGTRIAGYVIERVLGRGGMGIVYEAQQLTLKRHVALKVLAPNPGMDDTFIERFRQEGRLQAALDHPNIVPVFEAGELDEGLFLAMRLVRGSTLKMLIISRELEAARTLRLLIPVANALDYAHGAGLIHRDVKPQNILVDEHDHSFLSDFGLTRGTDALGLTRAGEFVGTIDYMSPEQLLGETVTSASDIYALGAVLYECLTGVIPYPRPSDAAVAYAHFSEPPPSLTAHRPDLPSALDGVIARAMAKSPEERFATAVELIGAAERAFGSGTRAAITPPAPLTRPEDTGVRPSESDVPTRPSQIRDPERSGGGVPTLHPGAALGDYWIVAVLERNGVGNLYRALGRDGEDVTLRILRAGDRRDGDRLGAAARAVAAVQHRNLIPLLAGGEQDGLLFCASPFIPGRTLRNLIDSGPLGLQRVQEILAAVSEGLAALHGAGAVHGDLRPELVVLSQDDERPLIADAGVMAAVESRREPLVVRRDAGPADYLAPEIIQGDGAGPRADVYALGCMLYEMLTGSVVFPAEGERAKLWAHVSEDPPAPSAARRGLVEAFDGVVNRSLAKEPDDRYPGPQEFAAAVAAATAAQLEARRERGATGLAATQPPRSSAASAADAAAGRAGPPAAARRRRRRTPVIGGLAVLAIAVVAAIVLSTGGGRSGRQISRPPQTANLSFVPYNRQRDAGGHVTVALTADNVATVTVEAQGLLNGGAHLMHIHAGAQGTCPPGSAARLHNGYRTIDTVEGAPFYGPVVAALTLRGDTTHHSLLDFSRFPNTGTIDYRRTFTMDLPTANAVRSGGAVIVVHGIDFNHNGRYDDVLGKGGIPGGGQLFSEETDPAICGALSPEQQASTGRAPVYVADLAIPSQAIAFVCHIAEPADRRA